MDSFFSLFDPSEVQSKPHKPRHKEPAVDAAKKTDLPKGRRRGRRANGKSETLPEECSFLCEPSPDLVKSGSYLDSCFEASELVDDDSKQDPDRQKRRNSVRKSRRKKNKTTPPRDISPWPDTEVLNNCDSSLFNNNVRRIQDGVGKNVNNLKMEHGKRKEGNVVSAEEKQVNKVIEQLEKVSVKDDAYTAGEFSAADLALGEEEEGAELDDSSSEAEDACPTSLPPEPRFGNVEYKLHLVNPQERRLQHLVTQLKWRLVSGGGAATYVIGVRDCGALRGLPPRALLASLRTLRRMAGALRADITHVTARRVTPHRAVAEIYIRKLPEAQQSELRIAVVGAHGAGKSTLIGVLTQGELDNGRGSARLGMFRHVHEVRSGSTSSLSHEILGFDEEGNVVNYGCSELMTAERIGERSSKLVSFLDLAGHSKYQRTTVTGLTGYRPHYAMLLVSATAGVTSITEEHMELIQALEVPYFTVVTKCDLEPRGGAPVGSKPLLIEDEQTARSFVAPKTLILDSLNNNDSGHEGEDDETPVNPVFRVSCVTGQGLRALHAYLLALQPPKGDDEPTSEHESCEFQIDEIFHVGESAGPVVGGLMARGRLREGDNLLIGPLDSGEFIEIAVKTIYRNRVPCDAVRSGQSASLGLSFHPPGIRQGMVLLAVPQGYKGAGGPVFRSGVTGPCRCLRQVNLAKRRWKDKEKDKERERDKNVFSDSEGDKERCRCYEDLPLEDPENPRGCFYFQANIHLLKHTAEYIAPGFQCTVHVGNVRQTAVIEGIFTSTNTLAVGARSSALFRLARRAEFLRAGRRLLCRAGGTRAAGDVAQVFPA